MKISSCLATAYFLVALSFPVESGAQEKKQKKAKPTMADFKWVNPPTRWQIENAIPPGVSHGTFKSESMNLDVGYYIYLPEAYKKQPDRAFPVVFHLHGGRPGSESKSYKLATYVDAAIKAGDIQPTIYVFPNGGPMSWYNYPQIPNGFGEDVFIKELIPHIKKTCRTREMAIEGFSQGGRGTTRIMFRHPELFPSAAPGGSGYEPEKRIQENEGAESENVVFAPRYNAWDLAEDYAIADILTKGRTIFGVGRGYHSRATGRSSRCASRGSHRSKPRDSPSVPPRSGCRPRREMAPRRNGSRPGNDRGSRHRAVHASDSVRIDRAVRH